MILRRRITIKRILFNKKRKIITAIAFIIGILIVLEGVLLIYCSDSYKPNEDAMAVMAEVDSDGRFAVFDGGGSVGLIFYPGGKVESFAYAPLMEEISEHGITCVLVDMPLNLAFFGADLWRKCGELCPEITEWYIGGHSLGGVAAASSLDEDFFSGIIFLASYPTSEINIPSLSIYGSSDGVLNIDKYDQSKSLMTDNTEVIINGGNHAGFGSYGLQKGDKTASISNDIQWKQTADAIEMFVNGN